jgi:hypothetical protein
MAPGVAWTLARWTVESGFGSGRGVSLPPVHVTEKQMPIRVPKTIFRGENYHDLARICRAHATCMRRSVADTNTRCKRPQDDAT